MNTPRRYFTSKEYNTIVLKLTSSSYEYSKNKEEYDLLFVITEDDIISNEEINHPISNS